MGEMSWFEAYDDRLQPLLAARGLLDAVTVAESTGLMDALRAPAGEAELAALAGLGRAQLEVLMRVLDLNDVIRSTGEGTWTLSPAWQVLTGSGAFSTLSDNLASSDVEGAAIRSLGGVQSYWDLDEAQRGSFARAVSPNPFDAGLVEAVRRQCEDDPEMAVLREGGTTLELGCGVAGRILAGLQAMPRARAVGVEMSPDLAEEARRRADALGVGDRFEVVVGDAADFDRPASFDRAFWSQFFFPEAARAGTLAAAHRAMRPGAVLWAPLLGDHAAIQADPRGTEARSVAASQLVLGVWGVPARTADHLVAEIRSAGFVEVEAQRGAFGLWGVRGVRP